jgi:CBS domain containing-hemolysin-like protein
MRIEREGGGARPVVDLVRPVRFIPETKPLNRLMREMQAEKFHLAIVADEYGAISGLITLEDCLEELVGDINDEHDVEDIEVQHLGEAAYLVSGRVAIDELEDLLEADLPDDDWDTIGGLIFNTLGHVPSLGEVIELEGWQFTVAEMDGRRVSRVRVERGERAAEQPAWEPVQTE